MLFKYLIMPLWQRQIRDVLDECGLLSSARSMAEAPRWVMGYPAY